jgi:hypothetical protein
MVNNIVPPRVHYAIIPPAIQQLVVMGFGQARCFQPDIFYEVPHKANLL